MHMEISFLLRGATTNDETQLRLLWTGETENSTRTLRGEAHRPAGRRRAGEGPRN